MAYTLKEVAERTGVTARTIRFYITQGLLPGAITRGRTASYEEAHVERLKIIKLFKEQGLTLEGIRHSLDGYILIQTDPTCVPFKVADDVRVLMDKDIHPQRRQTITDAMELFARAICTDKQTEREG